MTTDSPAVPQGRKVAGLAGGDRRRDHALVADSLSSALGSPYQPMSLVPEQGVPALRYLADWLGARWAWALFAFAVGWASRRLRAAVPRAVIGLWLAVLAYYVCDAVPHVNDALSIAEIALWATVSAFVGPVMGAVGWAARRPSLWSVVPGAIMPLLMVVDTLWAPTGPDNLRPGIQWGVCAGAAALAVAVMGRTRGLIRRRP